MKKPQLLLLNLFLLGGLMACGGKPPAEETPETTTQVETSSETETPPTPAETAEPETAETTESVAPGPGWKKLEGGGVVIWLPETYDGGVPGEEIEFLAERIRQINPEFSQMAAMIEQNPGMFSLLAFDSEVGDSAFLTNINIVKEILPSSLTIDTYLDLTRNQLPPQFKIVEEELLEINTYPAARLTIELDMVGTLVKQAVYIVRTENQAWVITCATSAAEFGDRLPNFEKIAKSFSLSS